MKHHGCHSLSCQAPHKRKEAPTSMDLVDSGAATSAGDNKRRGNKKNKDCRKRLHLRKTVVQPPTMQSEDKRGPKKIAEEWKQSTAWPSSKKPPQAAQQSHHGTNDSGNTLRFTCSQCRDDLEYVPKDLVRHFEEKHRGSPPVFSCHVCSFNTHEFSYFQVHQLSHKDTFSSCSICNDNVQRTWPEFSTHLTKFHCHNGKFSCEMCQNFSTGDVSVFLEHMYVHSLGLEGADDDLSLHTNDKNKFAPKMTTRTSCCQHCGYEAPHKWLITKHMKAVHVCQNGNRREKKKKRESLPKMKPRLTRSAVRQMCWLTQDCLSLPGREFLDKYCHLSDPQTTLEETRQFLMKSVTGETGDQKWTKALKTVLSNVPQDMNLHPKSENGIMSNSSDLTVLTVKNKITVAQNGASYANRLKVTASSDKDMASPDSAAEHAHFAVDQNGCQSEGNDRAPCPQTETKLNSDVSMPAQSEPSEHTHRQENRENRELETDQETGKKHEEPMHVDGTTISRELKLTHEREEQTPTRKAVPKNKRRNRQRKRKTRSKKVDKRSPGLALKIVLKKNPVKEKQWVSQSSLSGPTDGCHEPPGPNKTAEEARAPGNALLTEAHQKKWTKACRTDLHDPSEAITSIPQSKWGEEVTSSCATKSTGSKNTDGKAAVALEGARCTHPEMWADTGKSPQFLETEVDKSSPAGETGRSHLRAAVELSSENERTPGSGVDGSAAAIKMSLGADGAIPHSSESSQAALTSQGKENSEDFPHAASSEHSEQVAEGTREGGVAPASGPDLLSSTEPPAGTAIRQEPSAASRYQRHLAPKNLQRTLKLVAINPSQPVKRPAGDQPVVVLNHPDADIPEVSRIMEVVHRYRGEVQKVVLSRRTLSALSALTGDGPEANCAAAGAGANCVQERFMLKLKLRRLSRKKYEIVGAASPSRDGETKFRCWFCGRVFASRETWTVHRQRHLMEWKRPNCENS